MIHRIFINITLHCDSDKRVHFEFSLRIIRFKIYFTFTIIDYNKSIVYSKRMCDFIYQRFNVSNQIEKYFRRYKTNRTNCRAILENVPVITQSSL